MKQALLACVSALALTGAASAADLSRKPPPPVTKAPPADSSDEADEAAMPENAAAADNVAGSASAAPAKPVAPSEKPAPAAAAESVTSTTPVKAVTPASPATTGDAAALARTLEVESAPASANSAAQKPKLTLLALKAGTVYAVTDYWRDEDHLIYVLPNGKEGQVDMSDLDWKTTTQLNTDRSVKVTLREGR